jgi:glutaryl-CoA dehydrogenase
VVGFDVVLSYAKPRKQFGQLLAGFQIVRQRPVRMLAGLTAMQMYCLQMTRLAEQGKLGDTLAGLGKLHNTTKARTIVAEGRDLLGSNGLLLDFHVVRHMVDIEAIHTFEGTQTIQTLIVGGHITGIGAFT